MVYPEQKDVSRVATAGRKRRHGRPLKPFPAQVEARPEEVARVFFESLLVSKL